MAGASAVGEEKRRVVIVGGERTGLEAAVKGQHTKTVLRVSGEFVGAKIGGV
jgi:hypothetical protein